MNYYDTVERVMSLLKEKKVCSSSRKSHRDCYESLGLYLDQNNTKYTVKARDKWFSELKERLPSQRCVIWLRYVYQLEEMDSSGTVSDRRLYLNQSIYDKLPISWKKDLDFYLADCCKRYTKRTLELTRTYCSEGLLIFDEIGVINISKISYKAVLILINTKMYQSEETQDTIPKLILQHMLSKVLSDTEILRILSIEKEMYKKQVSALYKDDIIDQYYGLKIQYLYPFISGKTFTYVPSPYLVVNAVTESMLNRITYHDNKLRRAIGKEVIENYLYDIVEQLDTVTWITPELSYTIGKDKCLTSDVIAAEENKVIFYDTKAITPSLKLRKFDKAEIENDIKIYAEDVIQIYKQIRNYLKGLFKLNKDYSREDIFGIVVVLEDAVVSRKKVYEKAYEILQEGETLSEEDKHYICSHIKVMPLRSIESMILQNTSLLPELQAQLNTPERWYDYTYTNETTKNGLIPLYEQYEQNIKCRIRNLI